MKQRKETHLGDLGPVPGLHEYLADIDEKVRKVLLVLTGEAAGVFKGDCSGQVANASVAREVPLKDATPSKWLQHWTWTSATICGIHIPSSNTIDAIRYPLARIPTSKPITSPSTMDNNAATRTKDMLQSLWKDIFCTGFSCEALYQSFVSRFGHYLPNLAQLSTFLNDSNLYDDRKKQWTIIPEDISHSDLVLELQQILKEIASHFKYGGRKIQALTQEELLVPIHRPDKKSDDIWMLISFSGPEERP
ncbi:hypothetical protein NLJ89_g719 [Agrocybe chaxingu]|uniref:Uncharacterized protein n=1 Tax=Agrocybe chaxingu TaxID=84603 RepID=A0A9W8N1G5_9AGAR|nr:hypothetical protein NLJ89_g719 [Agrocybe chaxingu]